MAEASISEGAVTPGRVRRAGPWAVGQTRDGELFAVSRLCRHQLGDLSKGSIDPNGCLVCPWHQARYDVRTGAMVKGPRGFLGYHGPTPGYTELMKVVGQVVRLRVGTAVRRLGRIVVT